MSHLTDEDKEILREWARGDEVYTDDWDETLFAAVESIVATREAKAAAKAQAEAWDECCQAFAWALDNGTDEQAIQYVRDHNPRLRCTCDPGPEGQHQLDRCALADELDPPDRSKA